VNRRTLAGAILALLLMLAVGGVISVTAEPEYLYYRFDVAAQEDSLLPLPGASERCAALLSQLGAERIGQLRLVIDLPQPERDGSIRRESLDDLSFMVTGPGGELRAVVEQPGMSRLHTATVDNREVIYGVITGSTQFPDDVLATVGVIAIPDGEAVFTLTLGMPLGLAFGDLQPTDDYLRLMTPEDHMERR
jgi:hypothetical protein